MTDLITQIQEWGLETFPEATAQSVLLHLQEEIGELWAEVDQGTPVNEELADCFILLIQLARQLDLDVYEEVHKKFEINKTRTWEKVDAGFWKHVE